MSNPTKDKRTTAPKGARTYATTRFPRATKLGSYASEQEALKAYMEQLEYMRKKGLMNVYHLFREPLTKTRDGYLNYNGPWGVFIQPRS